MPYRPTGDRARNRASAVIELSIPMRIVRGNRESDAADEEEDAVTCYICANAFCSAEECCRAMTHLGCCTQSICCGCLLKSSKRCTCKEDCDAVISLCPFCREVSSVDALDIFLGGKTPCAACLKAEEPTAANACPTGDPLEDEETVDGQ